MGGQVAVGGVMAGASTWTDHQIAWQVCAGAFWLRRAMIVDARSVERVLRQFRQSNGAAGANTNVTLKLNTALVLANDRVAYC